MLIAIGSLFALDHFTEFSFWRTWPSILILLGLLSLGERMVPKTERGVGMDRGGAQ
ncbi:MAG: LiaI-LiaF-like domain-containing protein [Bryobacteraceae bacterium]